MATAYPDRRSKGVHRKLVEPFHWEISVPDVAIFRIQEAAQGIARKQSKIGPRRWCRALPGVGVGCVCEDIPDCPLILNARVDQIVM